MSRKRTSRQTTSRIESELATLPSSTPRTLPIQSQLSALTTSSSSSQPSPTKVAAHKMVVSLDFEERGIWDNTGIVCSSRDRSSPTGEKFEDQYIQSYNMEVYDEMSKLLFRMTGKDSSIAGDGNDKKEDYVIPFLEVVLNHLQGVQVLELSLAHSASTPKNSCRSNEVLFDDYYDYHYIYAILHEAIYNPRPINELSISGGVYALDRIFEILEDLNTSSDNQTTTSYNYNIRQLAVDHQITLQELMSTNTELGAQTIYTLSRLISPAKDGQAIETLKMNGSISSRQNLHILCEAISNSTALRHLNLESDLLEENRRTKRILATAICRNQSVTHFTTNHIVVETQEDIEFIKALSENHDMIKAFDITWSYPNFGKGFNDTIVSMLETNSWFGELVFLFSDSELNVTFPSEMKPFFQAFERNSSLKALEFHGFMTFSPEATQNLWIALRKNESLERLIFNDWGSLQYNNSGSGAGIKLPQGWDHEFIVSVLPNLSSVSELELVAMNLSLQDTFELWKTLAFNKQMVLKKLSIEHIQSEYEEWEKALTILLPCFTLKELYIPSFQPNRVGWNVLLEALAENRHLEIFETAYFPSKMHGDDEPLDTYEADSFEQARRLLMLNKAGRCIERCKQAAASNPNLCPEVLERMNKLRFLLEKSSSSSSTSSSWISSSSEKENAFKADMIYHFLKGPYLSPILVLNHNFSNMESR